MAVIPHDWTSAPIDWSKVPLGRPASAMFREELEGAAERPPQAAEVRLEDSPDKVFGWLAGRDGAVLRKAIIIRHLDDADFLKSYELAGATAMAVTSDLTLLTREFTHAVSEEDRLSAVTETDLYARGTVPLYASKDFNIATGSTLFRWRAVMVPAAAAEFVFDLEEFIPS